jgi:hypothetical protein
MSVIKVGVRITPGAREFLWAGHLPPETNQIEDFELSGLIIITLTFKLTEAPFR